MHACSGSGRHVIPLRIDIQVTMYWEISCYGSPCSADQHVFPHRIDIRVTMYWEISCYGSPCPADQLIRRVMPVQLYRYYSSDQLISRKRVPITRDVSVHSALNVNPKWNNMFATSWTSMLTASNRSMALPKLWQSIFLTPMRAGFKILAMKSKYTQFNVKIGTNNMFWVNSLSLDFVLYSSSNSWDIVFWKNSRWPI